MSKDEQNSENNNDSRETKPAEAKEPTAKVTEVSTSKTESHKKSRGFGWALFILILICAAFSGGGYLAYYYLDQQFTQIARQQNGQIAELSSSIETLQRADQNVLNNQRNLQAAITSVVSETENQLLTLSDRISESEAEGKDDWTLAEAEYLLRIANQRLLTSGDKSSSIEMMQAADDIFRELAYPELTPVRRQLADDLTRVQMADSLDVEGIFFELEALVQQVVNLQHIEPESLLAAEVETDSSTDLGRRLWSKIKSTLTRYIRIDTNTGEPKYLLSEEQRVAQTLSVQLQIRQAQLAMLSNQQDVYSRALVAAANSIQQYYSGTAAASASQARLRELSEIRLQTGVLDISESIRALSSVVNQLSRMGVE